MPVSGVRWRVGMQELRPENVNRQRMRSLGNPPQRRVLPASPGRGRRRKTICDAVIRARIRHRPPTAQGRADRAVSCWRAAAISVPVSGDPVIRDSINRLPRRGAVRSIPPPGMLGTVCDTPIPSALNLRRKIRKIPPSRPSTAECAARRLLNAMHPAPDSVPGRSPVVRRGPRIAGR